MVTGIQGYWMRIIVPTFGFVRLTSDPLPRGKLVYATISLSQVNTLFQGVNPDPKFTITAMIDHFTTYNPDGTESQPVPVQFGLNHRFINNCAKITYVMTGERVAAFAQMNIFIF